MTIKIVADRIFEGYIMMTNAEEDVYYTLDKLMPDMIDDISHDCYDSSLELYMSPAMTDFSVFNKEFFEKVKSMGFDRYWANFPDGDEIYCSSTKRKANYPRTHNSNFKEIVRLKQQLERDTARADSWVEAIHTLAISMGMLEEDSDGSIKDFEYITNKIKK